MSPKEKDLSKSHGIGAVARMTGLSTHILRMWERRYQVVDAQRAANGRRYYQPKDVEKLSLLRILTEQGAAIGTIAGLPLEELRERVGEVQQMRMSSHGDEITVAVSGSFMPAVLNPAMAEAYGLSIIARGNHAGQLLAEIAGTEPDVLLMEFGQLDDEAMQEVDKLMQISRAKHTLVAYRFARSADTQAGLAKGIRLIRTPVSPDELALTLIACTAGAPTILDSQPARSQPSTFFGDQPAEAIPARTFTDQELALLNRVQSDIDCECPQHLSEIVVTIAAFEAYSEKCESMNDDDAALHAYLHQASARARAIMEDALERLVEAEDIHL